MGQIAKRNPPSGMCETISGSCHSLIPQSSFRNQRLYRSTGSNREFHPLVLVHSKVRIMVKTVSGDTKTNSGSYGTAFYLRNCTPALVSDLLVVIKRLLNSQWEHRHNLGSSAPLLYVYRPCCGYAFQVLIPKHISRTSYYLISTLLGDSSMTLVMASG